MPVRTALGFFVCTLGLGAVLASAQTSTLSVTPNPATAGKSFILYLQGVTANCYTTFTRESVTVTGTRIDLRYTPETIVYTTDPPTPQTSCPQPVTTEGGAATVKAGVVPMPIVANLPTFIMPALAAGEYQVWASEVPACIYSGCKIAQPAPVSAGTLEVQPSGPVYSFTPTSVSAGQGFELHLFYTGFTCATVYDSLSVHVVGDVIRLSFSDREQTGVVCAAPSFNIAYGPTFQIPALTAGTYQVRVDRDAMNAEITVGTLQITGATARKGWYLKQKTVPPDAPFQMQLLRDSLPACTTFSDLSAVVSVSGISVSFLMKTAQECTMAVPGPIGPSFAMPAQKAGIYPITVNELLPCEVAQPACIVDKVKPIPSDTLLVTKTAAVRMSALRAGAPKVDITGNTAYFALPEGPAGLWRAELMTLDGRVLAGKSFAGAPGERVSMPVDRARANAVSLLRLTSPAGKQRFAPIVR